MSPLILLIVYVSFVSYIWGESLILTVFSVNWFSASKNGCFTRINCPVLCALSNCCERWWTDVPYNTLNYYNKAVERPGSMIIQCNLLSIIEPVSINFIIILLTVEWLGAFCWQKFSVVLIVHLLHSHHLINIDC